MKSKMMFCIIVLMLSAAAGSALAGHESDSNTWYGLSAGNGTLTGGSNTFIGHNTGHTNTSGYENTFVGRLSGYLNTIGYYNAFLGVGAGYSNSEGNGNTFIGYYAGADNTTGENNTFLGSYAGRWNTASGNTFIGFSAGRNSTSSTGNTFVGYGAGGNNAIGSDNTFLGNAAGNDAEGSGNIFIGSFAGYSETGSNKLYIDNSASGTPLIYGDFSNYTLTVHGNLGVGTKAPVRQLHVVGDQAVFRMDRPTDTAAFMLVRTDAGGTPLKTFVVGANASGSNNGSFVINDLGTGVSGAGTRRLTIDNNGIATFTGSVYATSFVPTSSLVYKTNVKTYENALETVKKLRGVSFDWKDSGKPSVGLIAEEVDKVIPAAVAHNDKDATGVNYDSLVGVLVEAVKEQEARHQAELKEQKVLIQEQQQSISALSQKVSELERLLFISNAVSNAD